MKTSLNAITLVDDEVITNFVNKMLLEKMHICQDINVYDEAPKALEDLIRNMDLGSGKLPEIMFVDINMPEMNGWEFINKFCSYEELKKRIKVYLLSSSQSVDDVKRAEENECVKGFIGKPLTEEKVLQAING